MELLTNHGTEYLLAASLEQLHHESQEWIKEVDFWKDEMSFFYKVLHSKVSSRSYPSEALAAMEKNLVRISAEVLDPMTNTLKTHEQYLATIVNTTSLQDEESYRERHKSLGAQVLDAYQEIRSFKKDILSFMRTYEYNKSPVTL